MVQDPRHLRRPVRRSSPLTRYFYHSLTDAARRRRLNPHDATVLYVAEMLTDYGDPRRLFDYEDGRIHLPALADLYRYAVETDSRRERKALLRRLGDVALFVTGLFPGYLERRVVGVDYYIAMGRNAYHYLERDIPQGAGQALDHSPFRELAACFGGFVELLSDIGRRGARRDMDDMGRALERWVDDGDGILAIRTNPDTFPPARRH